MKTIIYDEVTRQIVEFRDYTRFSYGDVIDTLKEAQYNYPDDICDIAYFIDGDIKYEAPLSDMNSEKNLE